VIEARVGLATGELGTLEGELELGGAAAGVELGTAGGSQRKDQRLREVLLVGRSSTLMWTMPYLMSRCGFAVDVVTTSQLMRSSRFVRKLVLVDASDTVTSTAYALICDRERQYDWVIACEDQSLLELSGMDWPEDREPAYLPLQRKGERGHIYSKIGLSRALSEGSVQTPQFRVAWNVVDALKGARELGYPVYVKEDAASGGAGVHLCRSGSDVMRLEGLFAEGPMLVQKRIEGREVDLSGVFFAGELAHFAYAEIERTTVVQALSAVRRYLPPSLVDGSTFDELQALGRALGANGFVSISCIEAADGSGRYFFEADMRPTVWVDVARLYGDDVAAPIRAWFERGEVLQKEGLRQSGSGRAVRVAHFQRLKVWEILLNRYGVWRTMPWMERRILLTLLLAKIYMPASRKMVPRRLRQMVKRGMIAARIAFP
jgi:hypothetical protein